MEAAPGRKIAIVGKAPSSRADAPYGDKQWEIWTLCDLPLLNEAPRWDRHFEIHDLDWLAGLRPPVFEWLTQQPAGERPIYLRRPDPRVPAGVHYPIDEVVGKFGRYFNNTVSYMLALAILEEPTDIAVFGVDMAQMDVDGSNEYAQQRPSCEFFLGWAVGAGINIHIAEMSDLLKCRLLYGFEDPGSLEKKWQERQRELQNRHGHLMAKAEKFKLEAAWIEGCLANQQHWAQFFESPRPDR